MPPSTPPVPEPDDVEQSSADLIVEISCLKRKINDLEDSAAQGSNNLFEDIQVLVQEYDRRAEDEIDDDESDVNAPRPQAVIDPELKCKQDRNYGSFQQLVEFVPGFKLNLLNTDSAMTAMYFSSLTRGATEARGDDIGNIKKAIAHWINKMVRNKVRKCATGFHPSASFYIRAFYKDHTGDPNDVEKNFLRGPFLVKIYLLIFTAPSLADRAVDEPDDEETISGSPAKSLASSKATKSTVAQKIGLKSVTPRSIAYVAVMLHFALTDASSWKSQYNGMDYKLLYNFIVDYFEDTPAPADQACIEALLKWWN
ncbi:hypothetical protein H0H81_002554, partial [Sphagnurus paluster]